MRESLQVMYKINRDKTVLEGLLFMVWCFVYFFVVMAVNQVDVIFSSNAALYNALLDEEFPKCVQFGGWDTGMTGIGGVGGWCVCVRVCVCVWGGVPFCGASMFLFVHICACAQVCGCACMCAYMCDDNRCVVSLLQPNIQEELL